MLKKGIVELDLSSGKRTLKFGTLSNSIFCELEGIKLRELEERLKNPEPYSVINFVHSAALAHCRLNKIEPDFTRDDVAGWMDEYSEAYITEMMVKSFEVYAGNAATPETSPGN